MEILKEVEDFIANKIAQEVAKSQAITKLLVAQPVEMWINKSTLITGSEAKTHYGFKLHASPNQNGFRDSDRVLRWEHKHIAMSNANDLFLFLSEHYKEHIMGWGGICSSVPIIYNPEAKFEKALYRFTYNGKFYEIFPHNNTVVENGEYVAISTLIACAQEWNREKDEFFLSQVRNLL